MDDREDQVCRWHKTERSVLIQQRIILPLIGTSTSGRNEPTGTSWCSSLRSAKSYNWGRRTPCTKAPCWRTPSWKADWQKRTWVAYQTPSWTWISSVPLQQRRLIVYWAALDKALSTEQPDLMGVIPVHVRGVGTIWSMRSFPTQVILWFYDLGILLDTKLNMG